MDIDKKQILDPSFKDKNNNSFQVMMDWEKPYMEKCIQTLILIVIAAIFCNSW